MGTKREQRPGQALPIENSGGSALHGGHRRSSGLDNSLIWDLRRAVGHRHVLTGTITKTPYCRGFRFGSGEALAVVRPGTLYELWQVLEHCVAADTVIIMQAANTGLTGGSTPLLTYDRPAVVINTLRVDRIVPILDNLQVVCFAGATLQNLEKLLRPFRRQPHSVLGSSCIGASVIGGVCNNSGGALVERGPAYTELALYARVTPVGTLELVNDLGIRLGDSPRQILERLDGCAFSDSDVISDKRVASARDYQQRVRDVYSDEPARYNADQRRHYGASGCAGKLAVFAVRLDTFKMHESEQTFFCSTNDPDDFAELRRRILTDFQTLPLSAEYIHCDTLRLAVRYGNDTVWLIEKLGTPRIPFLFRTRSKLEAFGSRFAGLPDTFVDRCLQAVSQILPSRLPPRVAALLSGHQHHLILKTRDGGIAEASALLEAFSATTGIRHFRCTSKEARLISLYRFAAAGAAIRLEACNRSSVGGVISLDVALPRSTKQWFETLPPALAGRVRTTLYYGHFLCHVIHQDYVVEAGENYEAVKAALLKLQDERGARCPAEHNYGHLYEAPPEVKAFYVRTDPTNALNPGVGRMSANRHYS